MQVCRPTLHTSRAIFARVKEDGLDGPGPWQVGENERTESFNGGNFALFEADGADKDRAMYFKSQVLKAEIMEI